MRRSVLTLAAIALAATGATAVFWRHDSRGQWKASAERDAVATEQFGDELASLKREVARLQAKPPFRIDLGALRETKGAARAESAVPAEIERADVATLEEEQRQRNNEMAARLSRVLAREPAEVAFRDRVADQVKDAVKDVAGTWLEPVECGGSLCRVILRNPDTAAHAQIATQIAGRSPDDAEVLYQRDLEATPPKTTLYVIRKGHTLHDLLSDGG
jgi:hypothetical protein